MKTKAIISLLVLVIFLFACEKDAEIQEKTYPFVITNPVADINSTGVSFSASVPNADDFTIVDRGFYWSNPYNEFSLSLKNEDDFAVRISSDLENGEQFVCRAYVRTTEKTVYGTTVTFTSQGAAEPVITDFSPKEIAEGAELLIIGSNFSHKLSNNLIYLNGTIAPVLRSGADSIVCTIPEMAFSGETKIELQVGEKSTTSSAYLRILGPEIENLSSNSGFAGDYLTITGQNFMLYGDHHALYFDDKEAEILSLSNTKIEALVPSTYYVEQLFDDMNVSIRYQSGMKSVTHSGDFVIKHSWTRKSSLDYSATQNQFFTYNNRAYIHEIWRPVVHIYDPENDSWQTEDSDYFPHNTKGALYITNNDSLYLVGGQDWLGETYNDLWVYDIPGKTWTQKGNLPFSFRTATYFETANGTHVITDTGEHWLCDFENEEYSRLRNFPVNFEYAFGFAFKSDNNMYMMVAERTYQYIENGDLWIEKNQNPIETGGYSQFPVGFSYRNNGYVYDTRYNFIYRYDAERDFWKKSAYVPLLLMNHPEISVFVSNDMAYFEDINQNNDFMAAYKDHE
ncbi:IPT/TIG domain-containing protein [Maribellus sediminis]|uniref:IPT/TIG domain-containing protein n=1 Tax=Maribellus sediminis TaxID=2696285 RepID=UPI0014318276|nr:IPT/TIG domain-containing protein [Maribellus sediminis]